MEDSFYDNLLRATDNTNDITNEKYATVTKIEGKLVSVKEEDNEIEHSNVPILNNVKLGLGDKVVIGFVNNSIYNPILLGSLEHKASSGDDVSWDDIQDKPSSFPPSMHNHSITEVNNLVSSLNEKLNVEDAFSGSYNDLSDVPTSFNPSSHNHSISDVSNLQTSLNAKLETGDVGSAALSNDYYDLDNLPSLFDGDYDSLTNKPSIPSKTSELTNDGDGTNVFVKNNDSRLSDSRTPTSHRASATTYGVGNASYYGHCRVINNLTKSSHTDGYALSAYQGYILKQDVDGKASSTHNHTKSDITDFPTLHTVATSGSYNDLLDKPNIPSGVVVDLNLDGTSNNAVANSAVVGGLNDKIEASDISFGFDADTKEIYIEVN